MTYTRTLFRVTRLSLLAGAFIIAAPSRQVAAQAADAPTAMVANPCPVPAPKTQAEIDGQWRILRPGTQPSALPAPSAEEVQAAAEALADQRARDWPDLCRYRAANAAMTWRPRVVFIGDSITEGWQVADPALFAHEFVNRGISGQTSAQMLLRFYADVVALEPTVVHIVAGTNDIAGNTGPTTREAFENNMMAMIDLARAHGIDVVIGSLPPAKSFWWAPRYEPAQTIRELNAWLRAHAARNNIRYVDYYAVLVDEQGDFKAELSNDRIHPNIDGYTVMRKLALDALQAKP